MPRPNIRPAKMDYIFQGRAYGSTAEKLLGNKMDMNCLRPYIGSDGRSYVVKKTGRRDKAGKQILKAVLSNAPATLRYDEWKLFDETVTRIARDELRLVADLRGAVPRDIPNAMRKTVMQFQSMTDAGNATISMDGLRRAERDRMTFDLSYIPIPIIHADFSFSAREVDISRNDDEDLDTVMTEQETRKCLELAEGLYLGTTGSFTYANGTIYGLRNHPNRLTFTPTLPTTPGWTPDVLVTELISVLQDLSNLKFRNPMGVYLSPGWEEYLDNDYSQAYKTGTLRERIEQVGRIEFLRRLDLLPDFEIILVELNSRTIQAVEGMPFKTLQWDSHAGMQLNWKIMGITFPLIRTNANGNTGIAHGVAA